MAEITVYYDGPVVTRKQAIEAGLQFYFTGKPCKRGHIERRRLKGDCLRCEYLSNFTDAHKEANRKSDAKRYANSERRAYMLALRRTEAQKAKYLAKRSTPEAKAAKKRYSQQWRTSENGRAILYKLRQKYKDY